MSTRRPTWRDTYKVHPAADLFPMMSDTELDALAGDIKTYGLREPIKMRGDELLDGRNRLEAAERIGWKIAPGDIDHLPAVDPVAFIISANIRRRHLTSGQLAAVLVKLAKIEVGKETGSSEPVSESKGGRGRKSPIKAKAVEINAALPENQRVSESSIKRAIAKAEGKTPAAKQYTARPMPKPRPGKPVIGIEAARRHYLDLCADPDVDLDVEQETIIDGLREIAGKRAMQAADDDLGDIPAYLDRRGQP